MAVAVSQGLPFLIEVLLLYLSCVPALSTSSMCFLQDTSQQPYQNGTSLDLSTSSLLSTVEWYNPNDSLVIHTRVKLAFTGTGESTFALNLCPCYTKFWNILIAKGSTFGPTLYVLYNDGSTLRRFNNKVDILFIEDNQYHDLLIVIDRVSTDSLLFNVSIDDTQYMSFLFTDGMDDKYNNPVSDSHVMAVHEFGYSRAITFDGEAANVYIQSFSVSGQPFSTSRYASCSNTETQSGAAPVNAQSASPCDPTASPTAEQTTPTPQPSITPTQDPTKGPSSLPSAHPTSMETTLDPTMQPIPADPTTSPTRSPMFDESTTAVSAITSTTSYEDEAGVDTASTAQHADDQGEDDGRSVAENESGSSLTMMMLYTGIGFGVCVCAILSFIVWRYLKRTQETKSVQENMSASTLESKVHEAEEQEPRERTAVDAQHKISVELQSHAAQQAMITAGGGAAEAHRQSVSLSDDMYVDKNDVVTVMGTGGNVPQYTEEGVNDTAQTRGNVIANEFESSSDSDNTPRGNTTQTGTKSS